MAMGGMDLHRLGLSNPKIVVIFALASASCGAAADADAQHSAPGMEQQYVWARVTAAAAFSPGYNFPVFVTPRGDFAAIHPSGVWLSREGKDWRRSGPSPEGGNSAYLPFVQHGGAVWSFARIAGDYRRFTIDPVVRRSDDYRTWSFVGRSQSFPRLIFFTPVSYRGAIWLLGGHDGQREVSSVWRSVDGLRWELVTDQPGWSPRANSEAVVFRGRIFLFGGGVIDGKVNNDVWSSSDGRAWKLETDQIDPVVRYGYSPAVFDGAVWLVGANRGGKFLSGTLMSRDGRSWRALPAPWAARGAAAVWTRGNELFVTGGKYSEVRQGETLFEYRNDVWKMRRSERPPSMGTLRI